MRKRFLIMILSICLLIIPYQASAASSVESSVKSAEKVATEVKVKITVTSASNIKKLDLKLVQKLKTSLDAANKKVRSLKNGTTKTKYINRLKKVTSIYENTLSYQKVYNQGTKLASLASQLEKIMKDNPNDSKISTLQTQTNKEISIFQTLLKSFYSNNTAKAFTSKFQTKAMKATATAKHLIYVKTEINTLKSYISSKKDEAQITQKYESILTYIKANLGTDHQTYFKQEADKIYSEYTNTQDPLDIIEII